MLLGDLNGDGKTDILLSEGQNDGIGDRTGWFYLISKGHSSLRNEDGFEHFTGSDLLKNGWKYKSQKFLLHDVNADGLSDLVVNDKGKILVYMNTRGRINTTPETRINITTTVDAQLLAFNYNESSYCKGQLITVKDGSIKLLNYTKDMGIERAIREVVDSKGLKRRHIYTDLAKTNSSRYAFKDEPVSFPFCKLHGRLNVAAVTETYNGTERINSLSYKYTEGIFHRQGLGFMGFSGIETHDYVTNTTTAQIFNPIDFGVMTQSVSSTDSTTYQYEVKVSHNRIRNINLLNKKTVDKLKGYITTSQYTYNDYGYPLSEFTQYGGYISSLTTNQYKNIDDGTTYLLGLPEISKVKNTRMENSITSTTKITYNADNQPQTKNVYYGDNTKASSSEKYEYNNYMLSKRQSRSYKSDWLTEEFEYDELGRTVKQTDPMGFSTTYIYSPDNGLLTSSKDYKGRETRYEYNDWGMQTNVISPDFVESSVELQWNTDPSIDALYVKIEKTTGQPVSKEYYNAMGQQVRSGQIRFDGRELKTDNVFDYKGRVRKTSLPFTGASATSWNTYEYDDFDRITALNYASGKVDTYSYDMTSVTTVKDGISSKKTHDASGQVLSVEDDGGIIKYYYRPDNQLSTIMAPGGIITKFEYDAFGRQTAIDDPSAGLRTYAYDAAGNIVRETDAEGRQTQMEYDRYNRVIKKVLVGEQTARYNYNTSDGLLASVIDDNQTTTYTYDGYDRLESQKEATVDGVWLEKSYTYANGNISAIGFKSHSSGNCNIAVQNYFYENGHLAEIKLDNTTSIWKLTEENDMGLPSKASTGVLTRQYEYDAYGLPVARRVQQGNGYIQDFSYKFDPLTSNLTWRKDNIRNIREDFSYDNLNRLVSFDDTRLSYDDEGKGNIVENSAIGQFTYGINRPYQIVGVQNYGSDIPMRRQDISYNTHQRPVSITENGYNAFFAYNSEGDRLKMQVKKNDSDILLRYYVGGKYELESGVTGEKELLYLDGDAYSASSVYVKENNVWTIHYICRDYLGNITHITNPEGVLKQEISYNAWGRLRDPDNQQLYAADAQPVLFLARGYTGHEHLPWFGLINMNARLYDPVVGRFLSPDPYVQAPFFSQNFNRYSYALNNPLRYNDPSGELFGFVGGLLKGTFNFFEGLGKWTLAGGSFEKDVIQATGNTVWDGLKIDVGMFIGSPMQIISRWTWEFPQSLVGNVWSSARNVAGYVDHVKYYEGATFIIHENSNKYNGVTLGSYINMNIRNVYNKDKFEPEWNGGKFTPAADNMMMHEYGHYLQSQMIGLFYLPVIGLPSFLNNIGLIGPGDESNFYTERWANNISYNHFKNPSKHGNNDWNFIDYPIDNPDKKKPWITVPSNSNEALSADRQLTTRINNSFKY
ncbi:RHS repeat-associated core domain-containing protein [Dysgonomonas sp. 511]|uniref:RHS repeat-associated core domain-containing protein n=1 Tax=Dysgonomonas sp. 511 TaxID=2302930 RepID=UPI0013D8B386|nr:RHS repeat-associated core domain-containing protein [Dysgonomonas sp. 511]